jgi:hypothetical protein
MAYLQTAKWFEHRAFLTTCLSLGDGHLQKGAILYWVWRDDRWLLVTKSLVWYRMYHAIGKFFVFFSPLGLKCEHFVKQFFGYTALHCALIDRIWSVKCTCMVCLCKYHNWVTQGVGSLLNLVGPTPTRRYHGWRRAWKFWKFRVSKLLEMAFSESSFCYLWL